MDGIIARRQVSRATSGPVHLLLHGLDRCGPQTCDRALVTRKRWGALLCGSRPYCSSLSVFVFPRLSRTCTLVAHVHAPRPAPSLSPFPSTTSSLQHQPQQYKASLMRTVIMMLIRSSSLMAPWVLSTSASPWSKHTVSSKYLRGRLRWYSSAIVPSMRPCISYFGTDSACRFNMSTLLS